MAVDKIQVQYEADLKKLQADLKKLEGNLREVEGKAKKSGKTIEDGFSNASKGVNNFDATLKKAVGTLAAMVAVDKILSLGKAIIDTTAKFEKFEAVLTNTLGSKSAAQEALNMIKEFAAKTPFQVDELTGSFVKLANQGFRPTADQMRRLGDLAASTGKGFDQLTEAIIDAQTGEFERLKEFGIRATKQGDQVTFAFKGVQTQTDFTNESIRNYILSLGNLEGVSGAMAAISETVGGKISNLGDAFDSLFNSLGSAQSGILKDTIDGLTQLAHGLEIALLTEDQMKKKLEGMVSDANVKNFMGFIEQDIKELAQVMDSESDARAMVFRSNIIDLEKDLALNKTLLEKQRILFGENRSEEQDAILKGFQDDIDFDQLVIKKLEQGLTDIDKAKNAQEESDKKRREREKQEEEKRAKERKEELKRRVDDLKDGLTEAENIEKQRFLDNEINEESLNKRLSELEEEFRQKEIALLKQFGDDTTNIEKQSLDAKIKQRQDASAKALAIEKKKQEDIDKEFKLAEDEIADGDKEVQKAKEAAREKEKKDQDEADKDRKSRNQTIVDTSIEATNMVSDAISAGQQRRTDEELAKNQEATDNELAELERKKELGIITEEAFQKRKENILAIGKQREAAIKTKDAQNDKKMALFRIAIDTASAIIKGIVQFGPPPSPPGIAAIASATALGLIESGIVLATPIPKFSKGVTRFKGKGTNTSDSNLAMLSNNESVINAKASIENEKAIDAMNRGDFRKYIERNHVLPALKRVSESKQKEDMNFANNVNNMVKLMSKKDGFNDYNLVKAIKKNSNVGLNDGSIEQIVKGISKANSEARY